MATSLQQAFSNSSDTSGSVITFPTLDRTLVNYIWINKDKSFTNFANPVCAIELANIKLALENAAKYPEADFNLWIDKKLLDNYSLIALKSFIKQFATYDNIKVRDLQGIPDYARDPFFTPASCTKEGYLSAYLDRDLHGSVYARADYARILVLDHCMKTEPWRSNIIYTDIDCPDLRLPEVLPVMKEHGIAVYDMGHCISNGYIGVAANKNDMKEQFKILKSKTRRAVHKGDLGYKAFQTFLEEINMPYSSWHNKIGLPRLLPEMYTVPEHLSYKPLAKKIKQAL